MEVAIDHSSGRASISLLPEWDLPRGKVIERLNIRNVKAGNPIKGFVARIETAENSTMSRGAEEVRDKAQEVSNLENDFSNASRTLPAPAAQESSEIDVHGHKWIEQEVAQDIGGRAARHAWCTKTMTGDVVREGSNTGI